MLIAAAGLAGAGKSTTLQYLASIGIGEYFYAGGIVTREVDRLGLERSPENEREARIHLREAGGMAALARLAERDLRLILERSPAVLIDAICNIEEAEFYRECFGDDLIVVAVQTSFENRATRLKERPERTIMRDQLVVRDRYEVEQLRIGEVIDAADHSIANDGNIAALEATLDHLAAALRP